MIETIKDRQMGIIKAYKFTDGFDFDLIRKEVVGTFRAKLMKDVLIIEKDNDLCFLFKYGVIIFWDFDDEEYFLKTILLLYSKRNLLTPFLDWTLLQ